MIKNRHLSTNYFLSLKTLLSIFLLFSCIAFSQMQDPVTWSTGLKKISDTEYDLYFEAKIIPKWHLYSQNLPENSALPTEFNFNDENQGYERIGNVQESESITAYDNVFEMDLAYFENEASFTQRIKIIDPNLPSVKVEVAFQACDDKLCIFRTETVEFLISASESSLVTAIDEKSRELTKALQLNLKNKHFLDSETSKSTSNSYWNIFLLGFFGGFLALLTPCVFPMIPLTVSYFLKQSGNRSKGIFNALLYVFFIVLIYGLLSLPFHFIDSLNPEFLNTISTNVALNLIFFAVFVFFAFSFFGYYDLTLPSSWGAKTDSASNWHGNIGIFFMALTLAIVSFSCTGPILGSLLVGSISGESGAVKLTVGMLGFGAALGLPFGLFALFPNSLKALPKSGGWMATVKVTLGFLELALALKFLSNADLVANWGLIKREVFVGIWLLISLLLTLYLFGVIRFPHDHNQKLSSGRKILAFLSLVFSAYLFFGLVSSENSLKLLSGFPPPEFYSIKKQDCDCSLNLDCYRDFETGRNIANQQNKPILLDFTGWACVNCRKMEENVWSDHEVYALMKENYIVISLYVDDRRELPKNRQFDFQYADGKIKKINTVGELWATFQAVNFQTASQPFYILITADGTLLNTPIQYTDTETYLNWLKKGLAVFETIN